MLGDRVKTPPIKLSKKIVQSTPLPVNSLANVSVVKIPLRLAIKPGNELINQSVVILKSRIISKDVLLESYDKADSSLHSHLILLPSISHKLSYGDPVNLAHLPTIRRDFSVLSYNNSDNLQTKLDNNWQSLVNWLVSQARGDNQFFGKLGSYLTRSRLGLFRAYHIKREFNLSEQLKNINNLWTLYNQTRQISGVGVRCTLVQKLQKLYQNGYLSTLQKLSILKFFAEFRQEIITQNQKPQSKPAITAQRIGLRARLGFKPKIPVQVKSALSSTCNPDLKHFARQFDKRWNKFIDSWFKNPINTHTQFEPSARYFMEQIYRQLMTHNNSINSNIPKLKTIEICLDFLRVNKEIINNRFEFATHLNDLYYYLPHDNYIFREELLNIWQSLFMAYQDAVKVEPATASNIPADSLASMDKFTAPTGTVERASVQVW
ncbi:MAG: hypothetical protein H7230_01330 [Candidatus Parcubacteria bacterium]|nr:hypothetical protein [Candidatus Paceibacterota bacterium]